MKKFSTKWKASKKAKKQRKYRYNAPLHLRHKFVSAHLSKELRDKYKRRAFPIRKGDEIEVMRGKFKGMRGKVARVDLKNIKIYVNGITRKKVDGSEIMVAIDPSNLKIVELNLDDKKRLEAITRGKNVSE